MQQQNPNESLDQATSQRLSKLRSMPVDTSRLDKSIQAKIEPPQRAISMLMGVGFLRAAAAGIATIALIGVVIYSLSGGPVMASPDMMAQLHAELISGKQGAIPVATVEEAGQKLSVEMPNMPAEHAMLCCMHSIKDKKVACVLLKSDNDALVTLAVAKSMDMRAPDSSTTVRGGSHYSVQSSGKLNMIMTERDGNWICLVGELPAERLMQIAGAIKF